MYLDTANIKEIREAYNELGIFEGVTTNPSILQAFDMNEERLIQGLDGVDFGEVFFQLNGLTMADMLNHFERLKPYYEKHDHLVLKVPMNYEGAKTISYLKKHYPKIKILATVVYSTSQGIVACQLGCEYIAPYVNRMAQEGIDPFVMINELRTFIDGNGYNTKIIAASFKTAQQVTDALLNGAHTCTLPLSIYKLLVSHKAVEHDIRVFSELNN